MTSFSGRTTIFLLSQIKAVNYCILLTTCGSVWNSGEDVLLGVKYFASISTKVFFQLVRMISCNYKCKLIFEILWNVTNDIKWCWLLNKTLKHKTWGKFNKLNGNTSRKQSLLKSFATDAKGTKSEVCTSHKTRSKNCYVFQFKKKIKNTWRDCAFFTACAPSENDHHYPPHTMLLSMRTCLRTPTQTAFLGLQQLRVLIGLFVEDLVSMKRRFLQYMTYYTFNRLTLEMEQWHSSVYFFPYYPVIKMNLHFQIASTLPRRLLGINMPKPFPTDKFKRQKHTPKNYIYLFGCP